MSKKTIRVFTDKMILEALQISYCLANCWLDLSCSLGPSLAVGTLDHLLIY